MTGISSLTSQLVSQVLAKAITPADQQRAALHVLDWLSCVAGALPAAAAAPFRQLATEQSGDFTALWTSSTSLEAALAFNAALGNVLEMDDVHRSSILHPGPVVIPAALAMAQYTKASRPQFLNAVLMGYEVSIRIGRAIGRSHYRYFHNTSSCAVFGAAMAAGYLLQLNPQQLVWALGNAGSRTGGLWQMRNEPVFTKQWHNAEAAKSGVSAARLGKAGLTGPAYILEGPQGLFAAMSQDAKPEAVLAAEGQWLAHHCSFKPWAACRHAHPAIDAVSCALSAAGLNQLSAEAVQSVDIGCYQDALTFCDKVAPYTEQQAKFSIQHAVAARILWGEPELSHYQPDALQLEGVSRLRQRIQLQLDPALEQAYPTHFGASCTLVLQDGRRFEVRLADTLGDPERPMYTEQLLQKASTLLRHGGVAEPQISALCQLLAQPQPGSATAEANPLFSLLACPFSVQTL